MSEPNSRLSSDYIVKGQKFFPDRAAILHNSQSYIKDNTLLGSKYHFTDVPLTSNCKVPINKQPPVYDFDEEYGFSASFLNRPGLHISSSSNSGGLNERENEAEEFLHKLLIKHTTIGLGAIHLPSSTEQCHVSEDRHFKTALTSLDMLKAHTKFASSSRQTENWIPTDEAIKIRDNLISSAYVPLRKRRIIYSITKNDRELCVNGNKPDHIISVSWQDVTRSDMNKHMQETGNTLKAYDTPGYYTKSFSATESLVPASSYASINTEDGYGSLEPPGLTPHDVNTEEELEDDSDIATPQ
ncbi:uncharacterized protein L201_005002 [Kwoniella dendrophila CBS 6074]|uniref:Uncharacterized protein n=1 Tax=Kwoniella dendrophila CBS 6074 TaxID=1295534 RepID=A0AAX4JYY7_9TREE